MPSSSDGLRAWIARELRAVANALNELDAVQLSPRSSAPARPRDGMIVYADGTTWNPGSGEGFYGYEAGNWEKL